MTGKSDTPTRDRRILEAMADDDRRAILAATHDAPRTAAELSDTCGIPISTIYRKVETLTDTGLLAERTRIRPSGPNCSEYALRVRTVHVDLAGTCACELDRNVTTHGGAEAVSGRRTDERGCASTDGGVPSTEDVDSPDEHHSDVPSTGDDETNADEGRFLR